MFEKLNRALAIRLTRLVGTMWCAYAFAVLAILGFPGLFGASATQYVSWISQTFIQLTMLSVIMVGQTLLSDKHDDHAENVHAKLDAVLDKKKEQ